MADVDLIRERVEQSIAVKRALLSDELLGLAARFADTLTESLAAGGTIIFCGNGGSAADATHLAAELVGRFKLERRPLPALSLSDNVSAVTAIANDYAYDEVFSRQVRALGRPGDVLVGLSTSGGSPNVVAAATAARELGLHTVALTGEAGGTLAGAVELCVRIPSRETARIQEGYMLLAHTACELAERALAGDAAG